MTGKSKEYYRALWGLGNFVVTRSKSPKPTPPHRQVMNKDRSYGRAVIVIFVEFSARSEAVGKLTKV